MKEKLPDPTKTLPGTGIVSDSAFPVSEDMTGFIYTPLKKGDIAVTQAIWREPTLRFV